MRHITLTILKPSQWVKSQIFSYFAVMSSCAITHINMDCVCLHYHGLHVMSVVFAHHIYIQRDTQEAVIYPIWTACGTADRVRLPVMSCLSTDRMRNSQ
jgi:hypothetical protein